MIRLGDDRSLGALSGDLRKLDESWETTETKTGHPKWMGRPQVICAGTQTPKKFTSLWNAPMWLPVGIVRLIERLYPLAIYHGYGK